MSTIICLKHGDRLVLGTDSRRMNSDLSAVESNTVEKLFELRPGTFLAQMGRRLATDRELEAARDLARTTPDIRDLAGALERELRPTLAQMTEILSRAPRGNREIAAALAGEIPIHRFVLAGRSYDELGWVYLNFFIDGGRIVTNGGEYFGQSRRIYATDGAAVQGMMRERRTFTDDPVTVVRRLLAVMRRADSCVGGGDQIAMIDGGTVQWVSRLEAERERGGFLPTLKHAAAVLAAGLFLVMPASAIRAEDAVFATGAIGSADIGNAQINNLHFDRATADKIQIDTADIKNLAVTTAKIGDLQVTGAKIANATIGSAKITDLDCSKLNAGTIAAAISLTSPDINISGTPAIRIKAGTFTVQGSTYTTSLSLGYIRISGASGVQTEIMGGSGVFTDPSDSNRWSQLRSDALVFNNYPTDGATYGLDYADVNALKVNATEVISGSRVANFASLKIGGTEVIDSSRNITCEGISAGGGTKDGLGGSGTPYTVDVTTPSGTKTMWFYAGILYAVT